MFVTSASVVTSRSLNPFYKFSIAIKTSFKSDAHVFRVFFLNEEITAGLLSNAVTPLNIILRHSIKYYDSNEVCLPLILRFFWLHRTLSAFFEYLL